MKNRSYVLFEYVLERHGGMREAMHTVIGEVGLYKSPRNRADIQDCLQFTLEVVKHDEGVYISE
jgi:hypothetical protein